MSIKETKLFAPEVWAGIECSYNRVNHHFLDQLQLSNHYARPDDIEQFAKLGIKALHYPVLWEKHETQQNGPINWDWATLQLNKIRSYNITPIVSLLHHGCGPSFTHLLDDEFAVGLSRFARKVADRFPWVTYYKPVNEPLTTARFSGLYGLWHPHAKDNFAFATILFNELKAVVLSMEEIRKVNPDAKLIQTEDLSKTYSTPSLQYQADFENNRRWLTYDILMGKLDRYHPLWDFFTGLGIPLKTLQFFLERPCCPDLLGVNHYVTSERYLDDNLSLYPAHLHGGNGVHRYVDVEAIRINHGQPSGLKVLIEELYQRYKIDIAITEVHLHCTREEQMRWMQSVWNICLELNQSGTPIKAFTVWALLGAYGWNKLLTQPDGDYESGIFDLRSPKPRPTALATMVNSLANNQTFQHPVLQEKGWWEKESRFIHAHDRNGSIYTSTPASQPLLIIGKNGNLGKAFRLICQQRGLHYYALDRQEMDLCDETSIEQVLRHYQPWAVVNAAGYSHVDQAESEPQKCFNDNVIGVQNLSRACQAGGIKLLTFSSAMVFDGIKEKAYLESDKVSPLNVYGRSKVAAEKIALDSGCDALVIRSSLFFSAWEPENIINKIRLTLENGQTAFFPDDIFVSPTYLPDLVNVSLDLLVDNECGIWHLANQGETSWQQFAHEIADRMGIHTDFVSKHNAESFDWKAPRPQRSVLSSERGIFLPTLSHALDAYFSSI
ncbi:family 1 glycosylhydrolase [Emticicia sp. C21]|uniref:family 1 glycosylhydrolase n=1 Tax=Emticicia sp. C21 TaxID=2302915 RepID=UPI000E34113C|nr:family 1 glycosylhydrolase [Emticicia sp. C21]RFS17543.1 NAD-dependent epimerase/dehydratase family protein [Emticicia sp. C21]